MTVTIRTIPVHNSMTVTIYQDIMRVIICTDHYESNCLNIMTVTTGDYDSNHQDTIAVTIRILRQ